MSEKQGGLGKTSQHSVLIKFLVDLVLGVAIIMDIYTLLEIKLLLLAIQQSSSQKPIIVFDDYFVSQTRDF